jgi:hypothetical protein
MTNTPEDIAFDNCVAALDNVSGCFRGLHRSVKEMTPFESERAAFQLMEVVFRHVNAVSHLAMAPSPGSHHVSAAPLLRSAFEIAATVIWLIRDESWMEREARWLGWIAGEETFLRSYAKGIRDVAGSEADDAIRFGDALETRRRAIAAKLPKDSRIKRPDFRQMLRECDTPDGYYEAYRVLSHLTHGGPLLCRALWKESDSQLLLTKTEKSSWAESFRIASWSVAEAGQLTLRRFGVSDNEVSRLIDLHGRLLIASDRLREFASRDEP